MNDFLRQVVVSRGDIGLRKWVNWLPEDLSSRPYAWLRPDFVPPSSFLVVKDPQTKSSRILVELHLIDAEFRKAWMPFFAGLVILLLLIPKADGDSTPLGQRSLGVLPVVHRLWASLRLGHLREWVEGWLPKSVFSLGDGPPPVEAWFSTALDIEEVLAGAGGDQLHVMVADVKESFDTVDRSILGCTLGRLGLSDWPRKTYFAYHRQARLRFKLAAGFGEPRCRDGVFLGVVLCVRCSLWPCMSRGVVVLSLGLMLSRNFMLIIASVVRSVVVPFLILLGSVCQVSWSGCLPW